MSDNRNIVTARPTQRTTVSHLLLDVCHDCAFRHGAEWKYISDGERSVLASVDELASVHAFISDEGLGAEFVVVGITEDDFGERCATTWVMDDFFHYTADVAMAFCVVVRAKLGWGFIESWMGVSLVSAQFLHWNPRLTGVSGKDRATTFPLVSDNPTHLVWLLMGCRRAHGLGFVLYQNETLQVRGILSNILASTDPL